LEVLYKTFERGFSDRVRQAHAFPEAFQKTDFPVFAGIGRFCNSFPPSAPKVFLAPTPLFLAAGSLNNLREITLL